MTMTWQIMGILFSTSRDDWDDCRWTNPLVWIPCHGRSRTKRNASPSKTTCPWWFHLPMKAGWLWTPPAANHDKGRVRRCLPARSLGRMAALFHVLVVVPSNLWPYFFNNSFLNTRSTAWNSCGICSTSCFGPPVVVAPTVQVRPATAPKFAIAWTSVWLGPCWWPHPWRPRDGWSDSSRSRGWRRWAARGDGDHGVGGARIWRWYCIFYDFGRLKWVELAGSLFWKPLPDKVSADLRLNHCT